MPIKIIKEFYPGDEKYFSIVILRSRNYGSALAYFDQLIAEAEKDFGALDRNDTRIVHYAGERYARTFGIEFKVAPDCVVPEEYQRVPTVEFTL